MSKQDIYTILQGRYPENGYVLMAEVSDAAGFSRKRSADYVAFSLWPSRGLCVTGIELKSSRTDWLNELKNPEKAENIFQFCNEFYLLTAEESIAKLEEIPITWGWLVIKGGKVLCKKQAPKLEPKPLSKGFIAAMLKRAASKKGYVHTASIKDTVDRSFQNGQAHNLLELEKAKNELKNLNEWIGAFEKASGIDLKSSIKNYWRVSPESLGEAVKFVSEGGPNKIRKDLLKLEEAAQKTVSAITTALEKIKPIEAEPASIAEKDIDEQLAKRKTP